MSTLKLFNKKLIKFSSSVCYFENKSVETALKQAVRQKSSYFSNSNADGDFRVVRDFAPVYKITENTNEMHKLIGKIILFNLILSGAISVSAQSKNSEKTDVKPANLIVAGGDFGKLQKLIDERVGSGDFQISKVSYRTKLTNLRTKGNLEISFKPADAKKKIEYRAIVTELAAPALERELNLVGEKGFRLLKQMPIPIEAGFFRSRETFVAIMEKPDDSPIVYRYIVFGYRNPFIEKKRIKQALSDGYQKTSQTQISQTVYLVLEKAKK